MAQDCRHGRRPIVGRGELLEPEAEQHGVLGEDDGLGAAEAGRPLPVLRDGRTALAEDPAPSTPRGRPRSPPARRVPAEVTSFVSSIRTPMSPMNTSVTTLTTTSTSLPAKPANEKRTGIQPPDDPVKEFHARSSRSAGTCRRRASGSAGAAGAGRAGSPPRTRPAAVEVVAPAELGQGRPVLVPDACAPRPSRGRSRVRPRTTSAPRTSARRSPRCRSGRRFATAACSRRRCALAAIAYWPSVGDERSHRIHVPAADELANCGNSPTGRMSLVTSNAPASSTGLVA